MKIKELLDSTSNSKVYNMTLKRYRESRGEIYCSRCPYHGHENYIRYGKDNRNWKRYRKTQWL